MTSKIKKKNVSTQYYEFLMVELQIKLHEATACSRAFHFTGHIKQKSRSHHTVN